MSLLPFGNVWQPPRSYIPHSQASQYKGNPRSTITEHTSPPALNPQTIDPAGTTGSNWRPDVYARPFIPDVLRAVNASPSIYINSKPVAEIDYEEYVKSFAGYTFLGSYRPLPHPWPPIRRNSADLTSQNFNPVEYQTHFEDCVREEVKALVQETSYYDLFKMEIRLVDIGQHLYTMHVPGLRENTPRVDLGDTVMMRQLRLDPTTLMPRSMAAWVASGARERGEIAPGFTGIHHNACVWGLDRAKETLLLRIDDLQLEGLVFNVMFLVQTRKLLPLQRAISDVAALLRRAEARQGQGGISDLPNAVNRDLPIARSLSLSQPMSRDPSNGNTSTDSGNISDRAHSLHSDQPFLVSNTYWIRSVLFPEESDGAIQRELKGGRIFGRVYFDRDLNYEQKKAVDAIMSQTYGKVPFLISGPPGTGKTKTIVEAVLCIISEGMNSGRDDDPHVLLCAPSDPAADTLALRLRLTLPPTQMFRLNSTSRTFAEVPGELLPYCYVDGEIFSLPPFRKLMSYRVIVTSCRDADMLVQARVTNRDLHQLEHGLLMGLRPETIDHPLELHWDGVLVDEAAQATEPEISIALTVVAPPASFATKTVPYVVMAGDQHQLGPRTASKNPALETSLLERLAERPLYKEHPLARGYKQAQSQSANVLTRSMLPMLAPPFVNLFRNYRSHPAILAIPNVLFYSDTLIQDATNTNGLESWSGWKGRRWPVLFACNGGDDDLELNGWGWFNERESFKACEYARSLIESNLIEQRDICIISPFRAQVAMLRRTIRAPPYGFHAVNIGPMEAFQGLEGRLFIICTTRTRSRFLSQDHERDMGIINEAKRFNVALTRAKEGLVVIGNPWTLSRDPLWTAFMGFCHRHELWEEDTKDGRPKWSAEELDRDKRNVNTWAPANDATPAHISRLEASLVYREQNARSRAMGAKSVLAGEDDGMWVSGRAAEEAMRD
ncbi:MAG: hypothetical protein M1819_003572 [Sarea resinae]|nr:MAG: hypothetical protein M1819_003572 [Sarea resinae]